MKIGTIELRHGLALGPMAGVTDMPFRLLCRRFGCELLYTEMVSAKAVIYKNSNTEKLLRIAGAPDETQTFSFIRENESENPIAVQLFGADPDTVAEAAGIIADGPCDLIDINMGCPVPKVVRNNEGCALMRDPDLAGRIIQKTVRAVSKPVTVKIRKGFSNDSVNAVTIAKAAEYAGASAIAVHARTREQYYSGSADWDVIRRVKEAVSIPVIGNGDVDSPLKAKQMKEFTGCDGVMIARAARGNPWIFRQVTEYLNHGVIEQPPGQHEICEMILEHARMLIEYNGEYTGIRQMRKHAAWYTAGMPRAAEFRRRVNQVSDYDQLSKLVREIS